MKIKFIVFWVIFSIISERIPSLKTSWVEDPNAFIFECKNGEMRKYQIKDKKKAFSAGFSLHGNLNIGDGDINIRSKEINNDDCFVKCRPKS